MTSDRCKRCHQRECSCGNHSYELGVLDSAVAAYLHAPRGEARAAARSRLGRVYREMHDAAGGKIPGQLCNGCRYCPGFGAKGGGQ